MKFMVRSKHFSIFVIEIFNRIIEPINMSFLPPLTNPHNFVDESPHLYADARCDQPATCFGAHLNYSKNLQPDPLQMQLEKRSIQQSCRTRGTPSTSAEIEAINHPRRYRRRLSAAESNSRTFHRFHHFECSRAGCLSNARRGEHVFYRESR